MSRSDSKRKIVFVNQATGYLTIDIINEFNRSEQFSSVALIAGSIRVQDIPLDADVEWRKISLYDRGGPRKKFISWLKGTAQVLFLLMTRYRSYEVFYITIPPFAYLLSLVLRNKFSVLVFDVYPDVLQIFNIKPSNPVYKIWGRFNRILFKRAHKVYTIGEGMANLLHQYTKPEKVEIIPLWTGLTKVKEISKEENFFISNQGLTGKFIVQYSGNIGYTHNVEVLVDIAKKMQNDPSIFFLIIGRGERYSHIQALVEKHKLTNCSVLPFQPDDILNYTLSAADLGVVLLDDKTAHVSIPSKIYNLQAVSVPILGIADTTSALAHHLNHFKNGACFNPTETDFIINFITDMKSNTQRYNQLRENSRLAIPYFTSRNSRKYFDVYVS